MQLKHYLFFLACRERQYLKQQQTAMKLSKAAGTMLSPTSQRYQWWTIVSIMLQARQALAEQRSRAGPGATQQPAAGALDPGKLMQLAESMAARIASKEQKLESFECLILWLDLLLALGKTSDALALVSGPLAAGVASQAEELSAMKADLLAAEGQLEAAAQVVRSRLESNPDDWAATLAYFDCLLPETAGPGGMRTSSLLWFTGGLAALSKPADGGTDSQSTSKAGLRREEEAVHASLHQCQSLVDELLGKVGSLADVRKAASAPADGGTAAPRLTMRGPHLAKVRSPGHVYAPCSQHMCCCCRQHFMQRHQALPSGFAAAEPNTLITLPNAGGACLQACAPSSGVWL
jgi:N-terminal acetyltransferase B complex non-catalytic subunit